MNYKLFLSLLSLYIFGALAHQNALIKPYPMPKILYSEHAKQLYSYRAQMHNDALLQIKNDFKITDADWLWYMDYVADLAQKDNLFANYTLDKSSINQNDHWLVKEAKEILIKCGIDPKRIEIKFDYDPKENGSAGQKLIKNKNVIHHTLTLNPDWFKTLSAADREAVIRHEIMHFANYDGLEEGYITGMLLQAGYTQKQIEDSTAIINYRQERESRADLLSVVDKPALALANQKRYADYAQYSSYLPSEFWKTHPMDKTRAQNMAELLAFMNRPALA